MEILAWIPVIYQILSRIQQAMGFFVCNPQDSMHAVYAWYEMILAKQQATVWKTLSALHSYPAITAR